MVTLLAESKTMSQLQERTETAPVSMPVLGKDADSIMSFISSLNIGEISELLGVSSSLAKKSLEFAYDFPMKNSGYPAISGFIGEAFKALDAESFSKEDRDFASSHLRFISSVYGLLAPNDLIKPYRLEFNKNCGPGNVNIAKFLKPKVTIEFVKFLKDHNIKEVIDLLPADASACLDWKIIRAFSKVYKVVFKQINQDGTLKTPYSKRLKELRGLMARAIMQNKIDSFAGLAKFENENFVFSPHDSKPGLPVFITSE